MTSAQRRLWDYIVKYQHRNKSSPTVREMAGELGWTNPGGTHAVLRRLIDDKHLIDIGYPAKIHYIPIVYVK